MNHNLVKIQVFVPELHEEILRNAISRAGGGRIGNYDNCFFVSKGFGYFRPLAGSNPTIGTINKIKKVQEVKIEFMCSKDIIKDVIKVIKDNHPYEEAPIDIFSLIDF